MPCQPQEVQIVSGLLPAGPLKQHTVLQLKEHLQKVQGRIRLISVSRSAWAGARAPNLKARVRGASGAALTVFSNFKAIDIFEHAESGEPKGMGRWPGELVDQPHRAGPRAASSEGR